MFISEPFLKLLAEPALGLDYLVMPSCQRAHSAVLYSASAVVICPR
jgi:hypothetical protein